MIPSAGSDKRPREACTDEACTIPRKNPRLASPVDSDNPQQVPAAAPASPRPGSASAAPFLVGCSPLGYVVDPPLSLMQKHVAEGMPLLFRGVQPKQWCRVEERHLRAVAAKGHACWSSRLALVCAGRHAHSSLICCATVQR